MKDRKASNKLKQKQLETKYLEEQTKKMEDKLVELKKQIEEQKKLKAQMGLDSTITRWQKTAKTTAPLKSYAKQILEEQKQAHKEQQEQKHSKEYVESQQFSKAIENQKQQQEERNPTKITIFLKQTQVKGEEPQKTVLEGNFFKAKMDVKKLIKQKTLQEFLEENYILQYLPAFSSEGIVDLEELRYITRQKLSQMGVKAGHQIKIIKKIKEEFDKLLQGKYQPPEIHKQENNKVQNGYGEGDVNTYNSVQQPSSQLSNDREHPKSEESEEQAQDQYQDVVLITVPRESVQLQAEYPRQNCYECYKSIFSSQFQFQQKYFCSEVCMEKYLSQLRKTCPSCGESFIKTQGYRQEGLWFCSLGCCPNHQEIEDLFFQWHKQRQ